MKYQFRLGTDLLTFRWREGGGGYDFSSKVRYFLCETKIRLHCIFIYEHVRSVSLIFHEILLKVLFQNFRVRIFIFCILTLIFENFAR